MTRLLQAAVDGGWSNKIILFPFRFTHPFDFDFDERISDIVTGNDVRRMESEIFIDDDGVIRLRLDWTWDLHGEKRTGRDCLSCKEVPTGLEKILPSPLVDLVLEHLSFDDDFDRIEIDL